MSVLCCLLPYWHACLSHYDCSMQEGPKGTLWLYMWPWAVGKDERVSEPPISTISTRPTSPRFNVNILHVPHPFFPHIITPCTGILGWACCRGRGVVAAAARKQQRGHTTMLGRRAMGGAFLLLVVVLLTAVQVRADSADLYAVQCAKVKEAKCVIEDMRGGRAWNGSLALALLGEISHR